MKLRSWRAEKVIGQDNESPQKVGRNLIMKLSIHMVDVLTTISTATATDATCGRGRRE